MYWKFLRPGGRGPFTDFDWAAAPGWVEADHPEGCRAGIHACRVEHLPYWVTEELWAIELDGEIREVENKVVAGRARLGERVAAWDAGLDRRFAEACVLRTAGHAAAEVRPTLPSGADDLASAPLPRVADVAERLDASLPLPAGRRAAQLCRYVVDAVQALEAYPVAMNAYISARAAGRRSRSGVHDRYREEREWQAEWLTLHLPLSG